MVLTQEALADAVDLSDRVIRRAEKGHSVDRRTIRCLANFFVAAGQATCFDDLILWPSDDAASVLLRGWLEAVYVARNFATAAAQIAVDARIRIDGNSVAQPDVEAVLRRRAAKINSTGFKICNVLQEESQAVARWQCHAAANHSSASEKLIGKQNCQPVVDGMVWATVSRNHIISLTECSNVCHHSASSVSRPREA